MRELAQGAGWPGVDLEVGGEGSGGRAWEFVEARGRGRLVILLGRVLESEIGHGVV